MPILSKDPRRIHDAYKEAVVDSLLNNLCARLAGRGDFYQIIFGTKPSAALISEFIVPVPAEERNSDEEADPIQISAHGLDFQVRSDASSAKMTVSAKCAVYVRLIPTADDVKPGGRLEVTFPLTREATTEIRKRTTEALRVLEAALPGGRRNPEWPRKSAEARRKACEAVGVPFDNPRDRSSLDPETYKDTDPPSVYPATGEEEQDRPTIEVPGGSLPDQLAVAIPPPTKWLRLEVTLPEFDFTPVTGEIDARKATEETNEAIRQRLEKWAASFDEPFGGQQWGYRRGQLLSPSDVLNWNRYLDSVRTSGLKVVVPKIELRWVIHALPDPIDPERLTVHLALENWTAHLTSSTAKELEPAVFQLSISVAVPTSAHLFLHLDRVKPSYRYNEYLKYPALGFNGGVVLRRDGAHNILETTWSPRYVLPRIVPTAGQVLLNIAKLAEPDCLAGVKPLVKTYEEWLAKVATHPVDRGLDGANASELAAQERDKLERDIASWREELTAIRTGIEILDESQKHWSGPGPQKTPLGIPFEAWLAMNTAMAAVAKGKGYEEWRLFQLAFILAALPGFATRIPDFHRFYTPDVEKHANAVTLLYFATGGGKSEAFLGLLLYVAFLDRLRGKHRGVSALMRYPLRLLTLQQARRTFAVLGAGEEVRYKRKIPGESFSLGFWVGGSNTPNWHRDDGYTDVPSVSTVPLAEENRYRETQPYKSARERWLKLTSCPFCGSRTGHPLALRRVPGEGGDTLGHFCAAPREACSWNARFSKPTPLPFYIVDEDIYDLAPTVLLGTLDKLAALGQSQGTIRKFFGMFGLAPLVEKGTGRLHIPLKRKDWDGLPGSTMTSLFPSFAGGETRFFDPFPSLVIQDEAHLLDESLGTFAGLFESALEAAFDHLSPLLKGVLTYEPNSTVRRKLKVVAASATVCEPHRQMRNLYQRATTVQFPYPGPELYRSFYAGPKLPDEDQADSERLNIPDSNVELKSHWARVYGSILTNGHRHTVGVASVLAHYHLLLTSLYARLNSADPGLQNEARLELVRWVSPGPLQGQFARLLGSADFETLLTLVNLHRIALTYVTNKKGGDQLIDTEKSQFDQLHEANGFSDQVLSAELISGAVSAADIQEIVRRAEARVSPATPFPNLNETLRSVIATAAISHGVDVEEFNAMFFAGMPSDVAEYIQSSSRVGRTHVGFSLLIPVPQRYRDRFVLEIHDVYHRFLERMILPAAVDRWAEKALVRVMPSFFQEYLCGVRAIQALCQAKDDGKGAVPTFSMAAEAKGFLANPKDMSATQEFMEQALGLGFSPSPEGKTYYSALLQEQLTRYRNDLEVDRYVNSTRLVKFFEVRDSLLRPMTSLRDVDQPGVIRESRSDAFYGPVAEGVTSRVMQFIRRGSGADIDATDRRAETVDE